MLGSVSSWCNQRFKIIRVVWPDNTEVTVKTKPTFGKWRVKLEGGRLWVGDTKSHFQLSFTKQGERGNESQQLLHRLELMHRHSFLTASGGEMKDKQKLEVHLEQGSPTRRLAGSFSVACRSIIDYSVVRLLIDFSAAAGQ